MGRGRDMCDLQYWYEQTTESERLIASAEGLDREDIALYMREWQRWRKDDTACFAAIREEWTLSDDPYNIPARTKREILGALLGFLRDASRAPRTARAWQFCGLSFWQKGEGFMGRVYVKADGRDMMYWVQGETLWGILSDAACRWGKTATRLRPRKSVKGGRRSGRSRSP